MSFTLMEPNYSLPADQRRRAKIVATLGPSCNNETVFRELVRAGLDVARLNFSHGSHAEHAQTNRSIEKISDHAKNVSKKGQCFSGEVGINERETVIAIERGRRAERKRTRC